jgi:two-component system sensor histidine kinase HydH
MQRARSALILVPLVMSAALIGTVLVSYLSVSNVLESLARGQGDALLDAIRRSPSSGTDPAFLERFLAERRGEGLRCIAVFDRGARPTTVVGECVARGAAALHEALMTSSADDPVDLGARMRVTRGGPEHPGGAVTSHHPLLAEFEPLRTRELERGASTSLGIGGAASLGLIVVAVILWRFSLREERMKEAMERDRRLASLGEMAAVLAHEIRNPLTSMKGHAQLLAERLGEGSAERRKAQRVVREAVRLEELTADLLGFVRSKQIERRPVDPREVLEAAAAEVGSERVELETSEAPARWSLDPRLLQQVLTNLLRNALQASPDGAPATARAAAVNGDLVFEVRDRGPGIAEAERERIFEPFYTTRLRGTGLGLAVARRIVALHGGTLTPENHPEGGAVFRVTIPRG